MQLRPWRHTTQMMSSSARDAAEAIASLSEIRSETCSQTIALIVRARTPVVSRAATGAVQRCLSFLVMINISMPAAGGRSHSHARADIGDLATVNSCEGPNGFSRACTPHQPVIILRKVQAWGNQKSNLRTLVGGSPKHRSKSLYQQIDLT
jgi:hypothetical protein